MKYRKYISIKNGAILGIILLAVGCASMDEGRSIDSTSNEDEEHMRYDGREPASARGDFGWLNQVEDDFGRIASETSSRAIASQNKREVLATSKKWAFSYLPKSNNFYLELNGATYKMIQTKINEGERFAFAAEGQSENPVVIAFTKGSERNPASETACRGEISYWSISKRAYISEDQTLSRENCNQLWTALREYVP